MKNQEARAKTNKKECRQKSPEVGFWTQVTKAKEEEKRKPKKLSLKRKYHWHAKWNFTIITTHLLPSPGALRHCRSERRSRRRPAAADCWSTLAPGFCCSRPGGRAVASPGGTGGSGGLRRATLQCTPGGTRGHTPASSPGWPARTGNGQSRSEWGRKTRNECMHCV